MTEITVNAEIARAIAASSLPIMLVDPQGRRLGEMTQIDAVASEEKNCTEDEWAEAKLQMGIYRREGGSFYTTEEVLEHLKSLEKE